MELSGDAMRKRQQDLLDKQLDALRKSVDTAWERYEGDAPNFSAVIPDSVPIVCKAIDIVTAELAKKKVLAVVKDRKLIMTPM